eukprot:260745-Ditylum_brightwellii.AAC.1
MKTLNGTIEANGKRFGEERAESGVGVNETLQKDNYWSSGDVVGVVGGHVTTDTKYTYITKDDYKGIPAGCVDNLGTLGDQKITQRGVVPDGANGYVIKEGTEL